MLAKKIEKTVRKLRESPDNVRFSELCVVCEHYFGSPRQRSGSHRIYQMPWAGDPRINIQMNRGMAKAYQVRQVLAAIDRWEMENEPEK